jgi:hypothetical protein
MNPLKRIEFKKLKGATNDIPVVIDFDNKKPVAMIYGENGTGKSSIIDAFDFVCNEQIGSFDDISFGSGKKIRYCPAINADKEDVEVKLYESDEKVWIGTLGTGSTPIISGPKERPVAKILRRHSLLNFIAAEPKIRYEQLSSFISTPQIDQAEKSLGDLIKDVSRAYELATNELSTAQTNIENLWEKEGKEGKDATEWAEEIRIQDTVKLENEIKELSKLIKKLESIERMKDELQQLYGNYTNAYSDNKTAETEYDNQLKNAVENVEVLESILTSAEAYFNKIDKIDTCPVCKSKIKKETVADDITKRSQALSDFKKVKSNKEKKAKDLKQAIESLEAKISSSIEEINTLKEIFDSTSIEGLEKINLPFPKNKSTDINKTEELIQNISSLLVPIDEINSLYESKNKVVSRKNAVITFLESIKTKKEEAEHASEIKGISESIRTILEEERKKYIDDLLQDISSEVDLMYQRMHPSEHIGNVIWKIDPKKRNSIDVFGTFGDTSNIPPQAYYSEAHLDTLGIAIFLGLAKKFRTENTIIILDDILTSVDQSHISRFLDILNDMKTDFSKIIITTHYRPWRDRYKYARSSSNNIQFIELLPWTFERGIRHTRTKLFLEELEGIAKSEPFDRQVAAMKAGIFLESLCDFLTIQYQCPLPRKAENEYTLGEFQGAFPGRFLKTLKIIQNPGSEEKEFELQSLIDDIFSQSWIRNQVGCHFNINGQAISDHEVDSFLKSVIKLGKTMICDECGELPRRKKEGAFWQCSCGKKRMLPLEKP